MSEINKTSVASLASIYKALGYDKYYAWDRYVADTGLRPEVNAQEFYEIYANVTGESAQRNLPNDWTATHYDTFLGMLVQIKHKNNVHYMVWNNGRIGSDPDDYFPSDRYVEVK